ncbi:TnsA endonuclease N-terminal domain-containing protein [Thalassotalea euphylliae]|uniref:TnsA endonuclease N-terminal domain-containing protein n=1 Tax=Thalassotalea euphylliae TaxID=1655234 RepID=A0A3E0U2P0_9GAMM|nr:TnsA endonuclease N-terminal domain-containing protein [Thalassotalea euphylliae]REL31251.1 hypothetical protein DXX94_11305 [Thalassotalea euphylliae]
MCRKKVTINSDSGGLLPEFKRGESATLLSERVRQPVRPTTGKVVGYFPSCKSKRSIAWESQLELKACRFMEFSCGISFFREQPCVIEYLFENKVKRYIPDFEVELRNGERAYIEVKPHQKLQNPEIRNKYIAISEQLAERNIRLYFVTENEVGNVNFQGNLQLILPYNNEYHASADRAIFSRLMKSVHNISAIEDLLSSKCTLPLIYCAIRNHQLTVDLQKPITLSTQLSFNHKESGHENCITTRWFTLID